MLLFALGKAVKAFKWTRSIGWEDPLILAVEGNGIQTVSVNQGPFFDYGTDGFAEKSGWVSPAEGLLCTIVTATVLSTTEANYSAVSTPLPNGQLASNGFQALAALDSNMMGRSMHRTRHTRN